MLKLTTIDKVALLYSNNGVNLTNNQKNKLNEAIQSQKPFIFTIDAYADVCLLVPSNMDIKKRKLLASRTRFKKMVLCHNGNLTDLNPKNFVFIWQKYENKPKDVDEKPQRDGYISKIFNDALPARKQPKACKHGYLRITRAYQNMENLGTLIKGSY